METRRPSTAIKILKQGDFQSTFLRQISDDMKAYKIWEPFINK